MAETPNFSFRVPTPCVNILVAPTNMGFWMAMNRSVAHFDPAHGLNVQLDPSHLQEAITLYEKLKRDAEEQTFRPDQAGR